MEIEDVYAHIGDSVYKVLEKLRDIEVKIKHIEQKINILDERSLAIYNHVKMSKE